MKFIVLFQNFRMHSTFLYILLFLRTLELTFVYFVLAKSTFKINFKFSNVALKYGVVFSAFGEFRQYTL